MDGSIRVLHCYSNRTNKLYAVRIDLVDGQFQVVCCWGKASARQLNSQGRNTYTRLHQAVDKMNKMAQRKIAGGYVEVGSSWYCGGMRRDTIMAKVDTSRTYTGGNVTAPGANPKAAPIHNSGGRAKRTLGI